MNILAIVVTYNGSKWIDRCFGSLISSSFVMKVVAIDNQSVDGTPDLIRSKFPQVEILINTVNLGFGKANNIGLKMAVEGGFDYAFLLNQDAWIQADTIERLVEIHKTNSSFGILCPMQLNGEGTLIDYLFNKYTLSQNRELITDLLNKKNKDIYTSSFSNAACWLIPNETILSIGGFDPLFSHYGEDNDYVNRAKSHNFFLGICPGIFIWHEREYRSTSAPNKSLDNELYIKHLLAVKHNSNKIASKYIYYIKAVKSLVSIVFASNKRYYMYEFKAIMRLLSIFNEAIIHRKNEKSTYTHYL